MGSLDIAMKVLDFVKKHPGKELRSKMIAKGVGASTVGTQGIMRRVIRLAQEPIVEGRYGREITFRYMPPDGATIPLAPSANGEVTVSIPTEGGPVSLTMPQARKVYAQLGALFGQLPQG